MRIHIRRSPINIYSIQSVYSNIVFEYQFEYLRSGSLDKITYKFIQAIYLDLVLRRHICIPIWNKMYMQQRVTHPFSWVSSHTNHMSFIGTPKKKPKRIDNYKIDIIVS